MKMKWVLMVTLNLMAFSGFGRECTWKGLDENWKEEVRKVLIQKARERLEEFIWERNIIRISEEPIRVEVVPRSDYDTETMILVRFHYSFKTQRSEISTDPNKPGDSREEKNDFAPLVFRLKNFRDGEGYILKKTCSLETLGGIGMPLFNLTLEDYPLWGFTIAGHDTKVFEFAIPLTSILDHEQSYY